jgi:hypothetical protein
MWFCPERQSHEQLKHHERNCVVLPAVPGVPVAKKKEAVVKEKAVTLPKIKLAEKRKPTAPPVSQSNAKRGGRSARNKG